MIVVSPSCIFPLLVDDTHILGLTSFVPFSFDHFAFELTLMGLVVQPYKCITWSPSNLPLGFSPHWVFRVPFGYVLFSSSFLWDTVDEVFCHGDVLSKLGDVHVIFWDLISMFCVETLFICFVFSCPFYDALLSSLLDPLEGLSMLNCGKLELGAVPDFQH